MPIQREDKPEKPADTAGEDRAGGRYARRLDEAPLRGKVTVLVLGAAVFGMLVGMVETHAGHQVWPMMLGLALVAGGMILAGQFWVATPVDTLLRRLDRLAKSPTSIQLRELPVDRADEVGRIAKVVQTLTAEAMHADRETRQLRRTLDHRIDDATRKATRQLREIAMRDALTGLGNRRFLDDNLQQLIDAAVATNTELVCVLMDLDNFKTVNDTLGHAVGDELLVLIAQLIKGSCREGDLAARLGGDEFVVLMPGADRSQAYRFTEQVRKLFRQQTRTQRPDGPHADVSAGIAAMIADRRDGGASLLDLADSHLYRAKREGKGRSYAAGMRAA